MNPGPAPVEVYAVADALVAPDFKDAGLLDTAIVVIRFENGSIATAEASFSAAYGYDVRGRDLRVGRDGDGRRRAADSVDATLHTPTALSSRDRALATSSSSSTPTPPSSPSSSPPSARGATPAVTGHDARRALAVALACIESVQHRTRPGEAGSVSR